MIVIFDLDGTISNTDHRHHFITQQPKDFDAFTAAAKDDSVHHYVAEVLRALKDKGYEIHIFTGRNDTVKSDTVEWLNINDIPYDVLMMRPDSTDRYTRDTDLKNKWLTKLNPSDILCAFDDRNRSVAFYRNHGIPCFQVAEGGF